MHESKRLTLGGQLLLHLVLAPRSLCGQKASSSTSQKACGEYWVACKTTTKD